MADRGKVIALGGGLLLLLLAMGSSAKAEPKPPPAPRGRIPVMNEKFKPTGGFVAWMPVIIDSSVGPEEIARLGDKEPFGWVPAPPEDELEEKGWYVTRLSEKEIVWMPTSSVPPSWSANV